MRTCWEALHASLTRSTETLEAHEQFGEMRRREEALRRFEDPARLVDHLTEPGGDLDEKDRIYARLVAHAQGAGDDATLAAALLWLGLWPGLDAIYRRHLRRHLDDPGALVSELWDRFTAAVHRADLGRIGRVAATLLRNTERTLKDRARRAWEDEARCVELPDEDALPDAGAGPRAWSPSDLGLPPGLSPEEEARRLRALVAEIVGDDDADLVIGAVLYGETQKELGERLGITHAAARKRFQRALRRLREHLQKPGGGLSHSGSGDRVS